MRRVSAKHEPSTKECEANERQFYDNKMKRMTAQREVKSKMMALSSLASLVQLVERRSPKPDVEGSSPSGRELYKGNTDG